MARLSRDALKLLAHMNAYDEYSIEEIAEQVFGSKAVSADPAKAIAVARLRATQAARALVGRKHVVALPSVGVMTSIRSTDPTKGGVQAQSIMNMLVRGGVDRRVADRRAEPHEDAIERRAPRDRRIVRPSTARHEPDTTSDNVVGFPDTITLKITRK